MAYTEKQQFLYDVMTTAVEGGCAYWAVGRNVKRDADLNVLEFEVADMEDPDGEYGWQKITPEKIEKALFKILTGEVKIGSHIARMFCGFPHRCNDMCDFDADGADCAVQVAAFGELIFG